MTTDGMEKSASVTAFAGKRLLASGPFDEVAPSALAASRGEDTVLLFDDDTGRVVDLDLRDSGTKGPPRGPGRPKLGVVAREVTLLPRHWDWLASQPGGASVALRRLVDEARRSRASEDAQRRARDACYAFMSAMAGDEPGFEEATRALFAASRERFEAELTNWPADIATHARRLAGPAFRS
jgi:hypothetical protein